mgnify:CR=1 FL=1
MWRGETSMERPEFKFKSLDHLAMKVRNLEKSLDFYVGLLVGASTTARAIRDSSAGQIGSFRAPTGIILSICSSFGPRTVHAIRPW